MNQMVGKYGVKHAVVVMLSLGCAAVLSCSNNNTGNDAGTATDAGKESGVGTDSGGIKDSGGGTDTGSGTDSGTQVVNGCTTFTDLTASSAPTITGPSDALPAQFTPNCVLINAGQSVTWNVFFSGHPLAASGGDTPSPIVTTSTGTTVTFAFPNKGTFGYHCLSHPTQMFGAVKVQ